MHRRRPSLLSLAVYPSRGRNCAHVVVVAVVTVAVIRDRTSETSMTLVLLVLSRGSHRAGFVHLPVLVRTRGLCGSGFTPPGVGDEEYQGSLDNPENLWAPFRSRIDWEFTKWANIQGPGSTAVSDLLKINGVSSQFPDQRTQADLHHP